MAAPGLLDLRRHASSPRHRRRLQSGHRGAVLAEPGPARSGGARVPGREPDRRGDGRGGCLVRASHRPVRSPDVRGGRGGGRTGVAAGGGHRPRRRLPAAHRREDRRHGAVQRLVPGVPWRASVALRRRAADRRQAGARGRLDLPAADAGAGPEEPGGGQGGQAQEASGRGSRTRPRARRGLDLAAARSEGPGQEGGPGHRPGHRGGGGAEGEEAPPAPGRRACRRRRRSTSRWRSSPSSRPTRSGARWSGPCSSSRPTGRSCRRTAPAATCRCRRWATRRRAGPGRWWRRGRSGRSWFRPSIPSGGASNWPCPGYARVAGGPTEETVEAEIHPRAEAPPKRRRREKAEATPVDGAAPVEAETPSPVQVGRPGGPQPTGPEAGRAVAGAPPARRAAIKEAAPAAAGDIPADGQETSSGAPVAVERAAARAGRRREEGADGEGVVARATGVKKASGVQKVGPAQKEPPAKAAAAKKATTPTGTTPTAPGGRGRQRPGPGRRGEKGRGGQGQKAAEEQAGAEKAGRSRPAAAEDQPRARGLGPRHGATPTVPRGPASRRRQRAKAGRATKAPGDEGGSGREDGRRPRRRLPTTKAGSATKAAPAKKATPAKKAGRPAAPARKAGSATKTAPAEATRNQ